MKIILASASPRRREILSQVGISYEVIPSTKEEKLTSDKPEDAVRGLSIMKALDVAGQTEGIVTVIGADTVVSCDNRILGKPRDKEDAVNMLLKLQGRSHEVYTGVAIIVRKRKEERIKNFAVATRVRVAPMTIEQIRDYVNSQEPMDKAGAYAIQGKFARYIEGIEGDYYNVVGLPIARLCRELEEIGGII